MTIDCPLVGLLRFPLAKCILADSAGKPLAVATPVVGNELARALDLERMQERSLVKANGGMLVRSLQNRMEIPVHKPNYVPHRLG
jgi:hypothetical protein